LTSYKNHTHDMKTKANSLDLTIAFFLFLICCLISFMSDPQALMTAVLP